MPLRNITDERVLLEAFRKAESRDAAFTQLIRISQERLYRHIRGMVVTHEDTNDVLQNVFLKVWKYLDNFRADSNFYTWIYRIATNETLDWLAAQKKRQSISIEDDSGSWISEKLEAEPGFDPNRLEWKLQQAVQSLPEKQKIVFNMRYFGEMSYQQMEEILGTSSGALKASYHHAVKKIEKIIRGD